MEKLVSLLRSSLFSIFLNSVTFIMFNMLNMVNMSAIAMSVLFWFISSKVEFPVVFMILLSTSK